MRFLVLLCFLLPVQLIAQDRFDLKSNIHYREGMQDDYMKERCVLDIQYPKSAGNQLPVIIWFHGGGLEVGDKAMPAQLKNQPAVVITANYRFSPKVKVVQIIEDAAAVVAWAFNHASEYGGDSSQIYVSGHSAGGYLTEMVGLDKHYLAKYHIDANRIAGLFPFSGQAITHFTARKERGMKALQPLVDSLAPLYHVRADAPPLYLYTGDRELELYGRYEENAYLARMMKLIGHKHTHLFEFDGYQHGNMPVPAFPLMLHEIYRLNKEYKAHH